jgi:hypothetical protein
MSIHIRRHALLMLLEVMLIVAAIAGWCVARRATQDIQARQEAPRDRLRSVRLQIESFPSSAPILVNDSGML